MTDKTNGANNCDNVVKFNDVVKVLSLMQHTLAHHTNKHFCIFK